MNKILGTMALAALLVAGAAAQGKKANPPAKGKPAAVCPVCKMSLSKTKTKDRTVAVRLKKGDKVMWCCAGCKMPDSVLVKKANAPKAPPAKGKGKGK